MSKGRCDGCGGMFSALTYGEGNTRWCGGCVAEASEVLRAPRLARAMRLAPEHRASPIYDRIQEDDGEL